MFKKDRAKVTVIIPAAGAGRRMKSYGPKSLIKIGESTLINNQVGTIRSELDCEDIILVCGFRATKLMDGTPESLIKIENELYETTNVTRSIGLGLRATRAADTVVVIYGDLVFNPEALKYLNLERSCIVVDKTWMAQDEVGCIIDKKNMLINMMYDLPDKWAQIAVFKNVELKLLKELCWDKKNYTKFGFEIINRIIEKGGVFECVQGDDIKVIDLDTSKDIQRAKGVLT